MGNPKSNKNKIVAVVIVIVLLIIGGLFVFGFNALSIPFFSDSHTQILVIGQLSPGERLTLDNLSSLYTYRERTAKDLESSSIEELDYYDIIILDQSLSEKSVSADLGAAIEKYVRQGGKLILVLNSATKQSLGINGLNATDSIGWKTTMGDVSPADCVLLSGNTPSCKEGNEIAVVGRIIRTQEHPIMAGVYMAPTVDQAPYSLMALPIQASAGAKEIAYFDVENTPQRVPAILEKKNFPLGNVIYFNYDPGRTVNIFKNTLEYLK